MMIFNLSADMFPRSATVDKSYRGLAHSEVFADVALGHGSFSQQPQNFSGGFVCKFRSPSDRISPVNFTRPNMVGASRGSTFSSHVLKVLFSCSKPQVRRVAARWVVTGMAHTQALRNRTVCKQPRHPTCDFLSRESQGAVAQAVAGSGPFPTVVGQPLRHLRPKVNRVFRESSCAASRLAGGYDAVSHVRLLEGGLVRPRTALQRHRGRFYSSKNTGEKQ